MNIGEISKPSVERSEIKAKPKLPLTSPVEATPPISDKLDLSDAARRRYKEYQKKSKQEPRQDEASLQVSELESTSDKPLETSSIFRSPPDIDYSYLVAPETDSTSDAFVAIQLEEDYPNSDAQKSHIDLNA